VSPTLQVGAFHVYKFFSTAVTYPAAVCDRRGDDARGTSWWAAFTLTYIITIVSVVVTIHDQRVFRSGGLAEDVSHRYRDRYGLPQWTGAATGDVAILTAAQPDATDAVSAQIATRIGGARSP